MSGFALPLRHCLKLSNLPTNHLHNIMKWPAHSSVLRHCLALILLTALLPAVDLPAQTVATNMTYQGWLADGNGNALGGASTGPQNYDVVFRIWDLLAGGAVGGADERYAEEQTVTFNNGYFSVQLGAGSKFLSETNPPLASVFNSPAPNGLFMEVTVRGAKVGGGDFTLTPRQGVLSAPYAFQAQYAANAGTAVYAGNLGTAINPLLLSVSNNTVGIATTLGVRGALTASNLSLVMTLANGTTVLTNTLLLVNGSAVMQGLNVAGPITAGNVAVTNTLTATNLTAASFVTAGNVTAGGLSVATNLNVSSQAGVGSIQATNSIAAGVLTAGSAVVTNTVSAGNATFTNLPVPTINITGTNCAAAVQTTNSLTAGAASIAGAVRLNVGITSGLFAAAADQDLQIIRGSVNANSSINSNGVAVYFTCTQSSTNSQPFYQINFLQAFGIPPAVVVLPVVDGNQLTPIVYGVTATGCKVTFINWGNNDVTEAFYFIAAGPR